MCAHYYSRRFPGNGLRARAGCGRCGQLYCARLSRRPARLVRLLAQRPAQSPARRLDVGRLRRRPGVRIQVSTLCRADCALRDCTYRPATIARNESLQVMHTHTHISICAFAKHAGVHKLHARPTFLPDLRICHRTQRRPRRRTSKQTLDSTTQPPTETHTCTACLCTHTHRTHSTARAHMHTIYSAA